MIMQEKNKSYAKTNSEFVSIPQKLHPFKNPHRLPTEPMGIHHTPHTHTIPIPMGIPIPTAALLQAASISRIQSFNFAAAAAAF